MAQTIDRLPETPSQTAGPYVHIGLTPSVAGLDPVYPADLDGPVAGPDAKGTRIAVEGTVFDGHGAPLRDAVVELWQADAGGIYNSPLDPRYAERDPAVFGWGRAACDVETGLYRFETVMPGSVPGPRGGSMAPHLSLWVVARGINVGLLTRVYFPENADANAADPILARIEHADRRETLIAEALGETDGVARYRFDIRIQGDGETVFLDA